MTTYIIAHVLQEVEDDTIFDDAGSVTFYLSHLHNPEEGLYLYGHTDPIDTSEEEFESMKYKVFDENGGI